MSRYRISAISAASPDMSESAFNELVEDIRLNGQLIPIWKSGDEIIDGRKRLRACGLLGIEPRVVDLAPGQDPAVIAYALNILRTHYTPSQRAMFAEKQATMTKADAVHRADNSKIPPRSATSPNSVMLKPAKSMADAAKEAGVGISSVIEARHIRRNAAPEVTAAVEAGRLTLHSAAQIVKMTPRAEQPAAVTKVVDAARGKSRQTPARVLSSKPHFHKSPRRPPEQRVRTAMIQLDATVDVLEKVLSERDVVAHAGFGKWIKHLESARSALAKIIRRGNADKGDI